MFLDCFLFKNENAIRCNFRLAVLPASLFGYLFFTLLDFEPKTIRIDCFTRFWSAFFDSRNIRLNCVNISAITKEQIDSKSAISEGERTAQIPVAKVMLAAVQ